MSKYRLPCTHKPPRPGAIEVVKYQPEDKCTSVPDLPQLSRVMQYLGIMR